MTAWLVAALVAGATSVATTPVMRRLALRFGIMDEPADRKVHRSPVPYLGGIAIALAALVALAVAVESPVPTELFVVLAAAVGLAVVGLLDDLFSLGALVRLGAQGLAAAAAVTAGVQIEVTGVGALDVTLTLVWIVMLTNAFNMLDNMDGLAGGVAIAVCGAAVVLAIAGEATHAGAVAGSITGAAAGYLVWNLSPRRVFMGDAGSMFLGYLIALTAIEASLVGGTHRAALVTMVLLVAVMLTDIVTVVIGRYAHGRAIGQGGKDHLSHRLVARGLEPRVAVAALVAAQAALAAIAVAVGAGGLAADWGLAAGAAIVAALAWAAAGSSVYSAAPHPHRLRRVRAAAALAIGVAAAVLIAADTEPVAGVGAFAAGQGSGPGRFAIALLLVVAMVSLLGATALRARIRAEETSVPR